MHHRVGRPSIVFVAIAAVALGVLLAAPVDPQTGDLVFAANDGSIKKVDPRLTTVGTYSAGPYCDIDGISFDPVQRPHGDGQREHARLRRLRGAAGRRSGADSGTGAGTRGSGGHPELHGVTTQSGLTRPGPAATMVGP
jgi:hypothetical protein